MQFFRMLKLDQKKSICHLGAADLGKVLDRVQFTGRVFLSLCGFIREAAEDDDEVTVPLLSASESRLDEENLTGLLNLCSLSIEGGDPSYAYQILISNCFKFLYGFQD